jgi:hypothetical protein
LPKNLVKQKGKARRLCLFNGAIFRFSLRGFLPF